MPVTKTAGGEFLGILSDNSLDRDEEFMTKELLEDWARERSPLPMLANHENKMEKFIGGWKNKKLISKGKKHALTANPFFFSKEANPLASQIKKQVEEALENGMGVGISIGAIPNETIEKEIDGETRTGFLKAEIVEATIVPIQSNRNASFSAVAKEFDIKGGPGSGPRRGGGSSKNDIDSWDDLPKDEYNEAQDKLTNSEQDDYMSSRRNGLSHSAAMRELGKQVNTEVKKMADEPVADAPAEEQPKEEVAPVKEAPKEEAKPEAEEKPAEEEAKPEEEPKAEAEESKKDDLQAEVDAAKATIIKLEKQLKEIKEKSVLKAEVEKPNAVETKQVDDSDFTIEKQLAMKYK